MSSSGGGAIGPAENRARHEAAAGSPHSIDDVPPAWALTLQANSLAQMQAQINASRASTIAQIDASHAATLAQIGGQSSSPPASA